MDIVIYMKIEDWRHKTEIDITAFWSMGRAPKNFKAGERIFIAIMPKGKECRIAGFVVCEEFRPEDLNGETLIWLGASWHSLYPTIPCKHFRGFRYRWWGNDDKEE